MSDDGESKSSKLVRLSFILLDQNSETIIFLHTLDSMEVPRNLDIVTPRRLHVGCSCDSILSDHEVLKMNGQNRLPGKVAHGQYISHGLSNDKG